MRAHGPRLLVLLLALSGIPALAEVSKGSCEPHAIDLTRPEIVVLLQHATRISPAGPAQVKFLSAQRVSFQRFIVEGEDGEFVELETSCMGSCSGNGCGVSGCNVSGQDCSACSCTGGTCTAQCDCTKFSSVVPK